MDVHNAFHGLRFPNSVVMVIHAADEDDEVPTSTL